MNQPGHPQSLPLPGTRAAKHRPVSQCVISFGSNLGDRRELIASAAKQIASSDLILEGDALKTSRLFETPPIGGPGGQEPFLNAIGVFQTEAPARAVLSMLQQLEHELGRQRRRRWDARSIDLDVVLHGNLVGGNTGLVVPHPRYTARQFVLQPACDVAAHFRDPRFGWTLQEISDHLSAGAASLALVTGRQETRDVLCRRLAGEHGVFIRTEESAIEEGADACGGQRWVSSFLPKLPNRVKPRDREGRPILSGVVSDGLPRLLVRIQKTSSENGWPAPHQMWPGGWRWPEYRLEIDDLDWAVSELASALDSMRCSAHPVTEDGGWW
ncbi:2-amino-4-hydroxy-6-hydroxymethyldihydropteridine pyrophosphokinase [Stieleria maiorica]|uniref:2-amino-4-hydroxy-6-hydroxymethyldihydropteridine pyrophosphokinase n=1 Tax=Stieleria maiorica TaxID=2795974 RepID=A0A5B9MKQ8_9BACT|nr:2-amino-4-hydroxy-6-hydroxymethyldihydropteridine diphosphokinase [Stieleria maiorica]QEG01863.1 2-amino-4-hydroxy-6-hydroxymethyldihydropteridine pyrophosphokinase [Stieleria maiorica]